MSWGAVESGDDVQFLVLGSGFIGSAVSRFLRAHDINVRVMSRTAPSDAKRAFMGNPTPFVGDVSDLSAVQDAMRGCTHVLFAVGSLMPAESERDPTYDMKLLIATLTATLSALAEQPTTSFTFVSSGGTVYGDAAQVPTPEDAPTEPIGSYGIVRLAAEKFVMRHQGLHENTVRIARLSNVYGPGQSTSHGQGVIAAAFRHLCDGTSLPLFGNGDACRDFVYIDDAAEYLARYTLLKEAPPIVNIGGGRSDSMRTVIETVCAVSGRQLDVVQLAERAFDVRTVELDVSLLRSLIEFNPRSLREGITDTWAAYLSANGIDDTQEILLRR